MLKTTPDPERSEEGIASGLSGGVLHPPHFMMGYRTSYGGERAPAVGTAGFRTAFRAGAASARGLA